MLASGTVGQWSAIAVPGSMMERSRREIVVGFDERTMVPNQANDVKIDRLKGDSTETERAKENKEVY